MRLATKDCQCHASAARVNPNNAAQCAPPASLAPAARQASEACCCVPDALLVESRKRHRYCSRNRPTVEHFEESLHADGPFRPDPNKPAHAVADQYVVATISSGWGCHVVTLARHLVERTEADHLAAPLEPRHEKENIVEGVIGSGRPSTNESNCTFCKHNNFALNVCADVISF